MKQKNIHGENTNHVHESGDENFMNLRKGHAEPNGSSPLAAPIGLEMETLGAQIDAPKEHSDLIYENEHLSVELGAVETAFREHSHCDESELELASWLIHLSRILDNRDQPEVADAVRLRAKNLVEHELNELDGFDR